MPIEPTLDDQILVRYLLGLLPEEQAERLDELSVSDDGFVWRLRAAENDLVDAYLHKELSGDTLERFRSLYLASAHRLEKVKFAETLLELNRQEPQLSRAWFGVPMTMPRWGLVSGLAAASVLAGVLLYENAGLRDRLRREEQQRVALAAARGQGTAAAPPLVAVVLAPPVRGGGPIIELSVPSGADRAAFALKLEADDFPAYIVALKVGSRSLWQSDELKPLGGVVAVPVPANLLRAGEYLLQLSAAGPSPEPVANYAFRVVSP